MSLYSDKFYKKNLLKKILREWKSNTVNEKKLEIKYKISRSTETEITRLQKGSIKKNKGMLWLCFYKFCIY